jgi:RNA polymerase sigma-70 factor (ECF subfamily)
VHALTLDAPLPQTARSPSLAEAAEAHLDDVYGYLLYLTRSRDLADELTGETFERAVRRWNRFDPRRGSARTWLLTLARSAALDRLRSESRRRQREERVAVESNRQELSELPETLSPGLAKALEELTAGEREVIALRVVLELDGEQTARMLGMSATAVSTRLSRALKKLEERMTINDRD